MTDRIVSVCPDVVVRVWQSVALLSTPLFRFKPVYRHLHRTFLLGNIKMPIIEAAFIDNN